MNTYRSYKGGDARLLEIADVIQKSFNNYNVRFLEEHTRMTTTWLQDLIETAKTARRDQRERAHLRHQTMDMLQMMEDCKELITKTELFANEAFANDPALLQEFDFKRVKEFAKTQTGIIAQMEELANKAEDYRDQLTNVGAPEKLFDDLHAAAEGVFETNSEQEIAKKLRVQNTVKRIEVMNNLWEGLMKIEKLAKIIFKNEDQLRQLFIVPRYRYRIRPIAGEEQTDTPPPAADEAAE